MAETKKEYEKPIVIRFIKSGRAVGNTTDVVPCRHGSNPGINAMCEMGIGVFGCTGGFGAH